MSFTPELVATATSLVAVVVVCSLFFFRQSRANARLRRDCEALQELVAHVRREAHSAVAYGSDVGKRLRKAEKDLAVLAERLGQIETHGDSRSLERAISVARQGVAVDKLVSNFGISRGEAELLSVVHGGRAAAR